MKSCACQYFSLVHNLPSISLLLSPDTFSIKYTLMLSNLPVVGHFNRKCLATPHLSLPVFISLLCCGTPSYQLEITGYLIQPVQRIPRFDQVRQRLTKFCQKHLLKVMGNMSVSRLTTQLAIAMTTSRAMVR